MDGATEIKIEKLDRIITIRLTDTDYEILHAISAKKGSNVSRVIRAVISMVTEMVKEK